MSGGKGGSRSKSTEIPAYIEDAAKSNLALADRISNIGYTPYYGPDVAAFSPQQQAAFEGTNQMADAFGMPSGSGQQYMPQAQTFEGGIQGYSSAPAFEQSVDQLAMQRPGQADYLESFSIDPMTGTPGSRAGINQPVALEMQGGRRGK